MGEVSETMTKRKKKGRPSLLDLQKRSLKQRHQQQQKQQPQNSKKQKLLVGLNSHLKHPTLFPNYFHSNSPPHDDPDAAHKRRNIDLIHRGSDQTDGKVLKATDIKHGSHGVFGPTTSLPDKKLLLFILDRLQKKDTHGVFSEPVDPEELPDYHDIIKHPMDFGTVRKKLDGELYNNFEQFEARAMHEIARKDFENLRQDSDDSEPQPKIVQRGRPQGKNARKSLGMSPSERVAPESSSDATLASGGDIASGSNSYNLRKGLSKFQPTDSSSMAFHSNNGGYTSWLSEWENEFPASVLKAVLRYGKKQFIVDETRRDTYKNPVALGNDLPVQAAFEDNFNQLLAVGLHAKHNYARSLARFAADLGPVVWKTAASKISSVLPTGHEFGPGRVADDDVLQRQHFTIYDERNLDPLVADDYRSRFPSPSGSFSLANTSCLQSGDLVINREMNCQNELNPVNNVSGGSESMIIGRIQQESMVHSNDFGSNGRLGFNVSPQMKMVRLADLTGFSSVGHVPQMFDMETISSLSSYTTPTNINPPPFKTHVFNKSSQLDSSNLLARESGFESQSLSQGLDGKSSWHGLEVPTKQSSFSLANDLNVEIDPQLQPNLALQL